MGVCNPTSMIENEKRFRPHTSHGKPVNTMIMVLYLVSAFLMLVPYLRYLAWILPLIFLFIEKESDFARFMDAQLCALALMVGVVAFVVDVPLGLLFSFLSRQLLFIIPLLSGFVELAITLLSSAITVIAMVLSIMAAMRANQYIQARILLAGKLGDRLLTLSWFQ